MTQAKTDENGTHLNDAQASSKHLGFVLPSLKAHLTFWSLALAGLVLDLWTKKAVFDWLDSRQTYPVIEGFLQLVRALNDGAAWGMLAGNTFLLAAVSIIALIVIFVVFLYSGRQPLLVHVSLGFFAAGVSGNLYDRVFNCGLVRDFIDVYYRSYHWPAFNVADSLLCIGIGLLIISTIFTGKPAQKRAQQQK
jgi:signal peptidase II